MGVQDAMGIVICHYLYRIIMACCTDGGRSYRNQTSCSPQGCGLVIETARSLSAFFQVQLFATTWFLVVSRFNLSNANQVTSLWM